MQRILFIICLLMCIVGTVGGQNLSIDSLRADFDKLYGLDILLNNGRKYFPDKTKAIGHPFWKNKDIFLSDVTISGKTFKDQSLKYNLNDQEFILYSTNYNRQESQIILNSSAIDTIKTGEYKFVPSEFPEINQKFVQLIYKGHLSCYIGWYKELQCNSFGPKAGFEYTQEFRKYYLVYNGLVYRFKNKSSFLRIFNMSEKVIIRKYLSTNRFRFSKIDENKLRKLIIYCNNTII